MNTLVNELIYITWCVKLQYEKRALPSHLGHRVSRFRTLVYELVKNWVLAQFTHNFYGIKIITITITMNHCFWHFPAAYFPAGRVSFVVKYDKLCLTHGLFTIQRLLLFCDGGGNWATSLKGLSDSLSSLLVSRRYKSDSPMDPEVDNTRGWRLRLRSQFWSIRFQAYLINIHVTETHLAELCVLELLQGVHLYYFPMNEFDAVPLTSRIDHFVCPNNHSMYDRGFLKPRQVEAIQTEPKVWYLTVQHMNRVQYSYTFVRL